MCQACLGQNGHWSNERTVCHYRHLAFSIAHQFGRSYGLTAEDKEDLIQDLMVKLVLAPASYRTNSSGIYTILKNEARDLIKRKWQKKQSYERSFLADGDPWKDHPSQKASRRHAEHSGNFNRPGMHSIIEVFKDPTDYEKIFVRAIDSRILVECLNLLPGGERVCISMFYGIGFPRAFTRHLIARKLRSSEDWVQRRLARAEFLLKRHIEKRSLSGRTNHA